MAKKEYNEEEIKNLVRNYDPSHHMHIWEMRSNVKILTALLFFDNKYHPDKKSRGMWKENRPADWRHDVPFCDPNNYQGNESGKKSKPSKAVLKKQIDFLFDYAKTHPLFAEPSYQLPIGSNELSTLMADEIGQNEDPYLDNFLQMPMQNLPGPVELDEAIYQPMEEGSSYTSQVDIQQPHEESNIPAFEYMLEEHPPVEVGTEGAMGGTMPQADWEGQWKWLNDYSENEKLEQEVSEVAQLDDRLISGGVNEETEIINWISGYAQSTDLNVMGQDMSSLSQSGIDSQPDNKGMFSSETMPTFTNPTQLFTDMSETNPFQLVWPNQADSLQLASFTDHADASKQGDVAQVNTNSIQADTAQVHTSSNQADRPTEQVYSASNHVDLAPVYTITDQPPDLTQGYVFAVQSDVASECTITNQTNAAEGVLFSNEPNPVDIMQGFIYPSQPLNQNALTGSFGDEKPLYMSGQSSSSNDGHATLQITSRGERRFVFDQDTPQNNLAQGLESMDLHEEKPMDQDFFEECIDDFAAQEEV